MIIAKVVVAQEMPLMACYTLCDLRKMLVVFTGDTIGNPKNTRAG